MKSLYKVIFVALALLLTTPLFAATSVLDQGNELILNHVVIDNTAIDKAGPGGDLGLFHVEITSEQTPPDGVFEIPNKMPDEHPGEYWKAAITAAALDLAKHRPRLLYST